MSKMKDLEIVKKDSMKLEFIENQTEQICLEAIKQNPSAIDYVDEPNNEMIKLAKLKSA